MVGGNVARATSELLLAFMAANSNFYEGRLPVPEITIQTSGRRAAYGWLTLGKIWKNENGGAVELNICAEYLARPLHDLLGTLLHEMAHLENLTKGIQDVTGFQYHNKHFKTAAERIGLIVFKVPRYGLARTEPGEELKTWINSLNLNEAVFRTFRGSSLPIETGT
ncbi:MAG: SprT-like domain-containing protein, partial [Patescibacteria group bacterium]|nr:SprT-like domain-containing protein [Patescibacteria group bacterium]